MRKSRQLSIMALCAVAALGISMSACDDDSTAVTKGKINEACSADKPCDAGLVCGDEGKCVEDKGQDPVDSEKAKLGEDSPQLPLSED